MPTIRILLIIILIFHAQANACDDAIEKPDCEEKSEFTWNPSDQNVTSKLSRFYEMEDLINSAYEEGSYDKATILITEYLELASTYHRNWNYGNAVHNSNQILGLIALEKNDVEGAANYLVEAGKSTGSPQLDSFGPSLDLANELLSKGKRDAVVSYLQGIRKFWDGKESIIDDWVQKINAGEEVQLNQYQPGLFEMVLYGLSLAWPLILVLGFWFKIKSHLSNNWSFPIVAVLSAFGTMIIGGMLIGPIVMALFEVVSEDILGPLIIFIGVLVQVVAPFLAVYLVARFFKNGVVPENG
ncbi:MAG: hypothetical protein R3E64_09575 [Halioglobus sp.]